MANFVSVGHNRVNRRANTWRSIGRPGRVNAHRPDQCPWFYGDYFRGKNVEECKLLRPLDCAGRDLCKRLSP
jgi:hypothetical protein